MNSPTLFIKAHNFIQEHALIAHHDTIIIGLSGGPDSVFLLHFLNSLKKEYELHLIAAHLNHEWRPDAHKDVVFCQEVAHNLGIEYVSKRAQDISLQRPSSDSLEEHGRLLRRQFFEECAQKYGAARIALGHHRDDHYATFFIRLLRGASITGLAGIWPKSGTYIHPLLGLSKQEILSYLHEHTITYLNDPTNEHDAFLRNSIRSHVIPALRASDVRFDKNFDRTLHQIQKTETFLANLTKELFATITTYEKEHIFIDLVSWRTLDPFMQQRLLMYWLCQEKVSFNPSQNFLDEISRFLQTPQGGHHMLHENWGIYKKKSWAWISNQRDTNELPGI